LHGVYLTEEKENVYGFLYLAYTNPNGAKANETQSYNTNTLEKEGEIYLYPYINE